MAALGLHCCTWAFSSCGEQGLLFINSARASHCGFLTTAPPGRSHESKILPRRNQTEPLGDLFPSEPSQWGQREAPECSTFPAPSGMFTLGPPPGKPSSSQLCTTLFTLQGSLHLCEASDPTSQSPSLPPGAPPTRHSYVSHCNSIASSHVCLPQWVNGFFFCFCFGH